MSGKYPKDTSRTHVSIVKFLFPVGHNGQDEQIYTFSIFNHEYFPNLYFFQLCATRFV